MIEKGLVEIKWNAQAAEKSGYEHFMMKEIYEQQRAVRDTVNAAFGILCKRFERSGCG